MTIPDLGPKTRKKIFSTSVPILQKDSYSFSLVRNYVGMKFNKLQKWTGHVAEVFHVELPCLTVLLPFFPLTHPSTMKRAAETQLTKDNADSAGEDEVCRMSNAINCHLGVNI